MMIINNLKELKEYGTLKYNDTLIFRIENKEHKYKVLSCHLQNNTGHNGHIFEIIEVKDKYIFCKKYYEYDAHYGNFPECKEQDYEALTRIVEAIYGIIEEKNRKKYLCLETIGRFELMDFS